MAITIPGSVTGAAQTGFTTPGYTMTVDTPPDVNSKQSAVTALTGTQVGVTLHTASSPFTLTVMRPKVLAVLGKANPITGLITNVPRNTYRFLGRKGMTVLAGQPIQIGLYKKELSIPAGAETNDSANVRALISLVDGASFTLASGMGDTAVTGILG